MPAVTAPTRLSDTYAKLSWLIFLVRLRKYAASRVATPINPIQSVVFMTEGMKISVRGKWVKGVQYGSLFKSCKLKL